MDSAFFRSSLSRRLWQPLHESDDWCGVRGEMMDRFGDHAFVWPCNGNRVRWQQQCRTRCLMRAGLFGPLEDAGTPRRRRESQCADERDVDIVGCVEGGRDIQGSLTEHGISCKQEWYDGDVVGSRTHRPKSGFYRLWIPQFGCLRRLANDTDRHYGIRDYAADPAAAAQIVPSLWAPPRSISDAHSLHLLRIGRGGFLVLRYPGEGCIRPARVI